MAILGLARSHGRRRCHCEFARHDSDVVNYRKIDGHSLGVTHASSFATRAVFLT
jgi:hypothetical protein